MTLTWKEASSPVKHSVKTILGVGPSPELANLKFVTESEEEWDNLHNYQDKIYEE